MPAKNNNLIILVEILRHHLTGALIFRHGERLYIEVNRGEKITCFEALEACLTVDGFYGIIERSFWQRSLNHVAYLHTRQKRWWMLFDDGST